MNYLANILTISSLAFGFVSIIFSLESHFTFASWAIMLSVIFDGLDGQVARLNPSPSNFGKELDSLVDVISFGIAPSVLGYTFVYRHFSLWATLALFFYLFCSVFRLANFNLTPKEDLKNYFYGLPTTASGGILASVILIYRRYDFDPSPETFLLLVFILAILMVSKVKFLNLDGIKNLLGRKGVLSLALVTLIPALFLPEMIILALFLIYLTISPFIVRLVHMPK